MHFVKVSIALLAMLSVCNANDLLGSALDIVPEVENSLYELYDPFLGGFLGDLGLHGIDDADKKSPSAATGISVTDPFTGITTTTTIDPNTGKILDPFTNFLQQLLNSFQGDVKFKFGSM